MNSLSGSKVSVSQLSTNSHSHETIRSVPLDIDQLDSSFNSSQKRDENLTSSMPHSIGSDSHLSLQNTTINSFKAPPRLSSFNPVSGINRISLKQFPSEYGSALTYSNGNSDGNNSPTSEDNNTVPTSSISPWNSAVGRASLGGKSGRVIERLMGENDMLKRELHIERLRAEEQKQAVKMAEGRMEALAAEYDGKLHEAAVNKTMLKRKERQLADLRLQVEVEKSKATVAIESERIWKEQIQKVEEESKQHVEDAFNYAAMMDARNAAMTNHWKEQGNEVNRAVAKLSKEIEEINLERKQDDKRLNTLQGLCDQQATLLEELLEKRNAIVLKHKEYKCSQEESLRDIKTSAIQVEEKSELLLAETQKVLGELKWALSLKKNERTP
ncbi:Bgt-2176 [Blumeria graminis f. sp. tritici]|uniref:Bgt-2176 n=2 Tax=Blumeria graminis f. sp. tritici TaxID=62690 RepID=A0A9X9QFW5_BLUGR|nr:hypothetical protein BGT96224_2176 [Blumeria graminis f. sp. tritici 96224]VDB93650.1 Bgt-2176 [Blumeria graminis f. sp. tritici]